MKKTIAAILPFVILLLEILFGVLSGLGDPQAVLTLFMLAWMVLWWVFEVLPLGVTALIPMVYLPMMGINSIRSVAPMYSTSIIYLFLGGFIIARALEKTALNERIALYILKITGKSEKGIVLGFIIATAFLSMWISNTATTVMMVPIALSVIAFLEKNLPDQSARSLKSMAIVLFLSIAYAANIGGITTPVGTPPNVVFLGFLDELYSITVDFWKWMLVSVPVALALLVTMIVFLRFIFPFSLPIDEGFQEFIRGKLSKLGTVSKEQILTLIIFSVVCFLWVFKEVIHGLVGSRFINDTSVAIMGGIFLFLIPYSLKENKPVLDIEDIKHLPWNIVLLFGGGMALAGALKDAGLIKATTDYFEALNIGSEYWLVFALALVTLFLTEIMSNVALCMVALPVIMQLGVAQGIPALLIGFPAAVCSSFAFSMPISTPPNAIVFGTNYIKVKDMLKVGILLNFIGVSIVMSVGWFLAKKIFT
ncbi:MAG: SLC13 family permease [Verrucomicrobiota bacterium]